MDALEQYLKIEKLDPAQVSEQSIQHKENKYSEMNSNLGELQTKGKSFIREASEVSTVQQTLRVLFMQFGSTQVKQDNSLDTRRAIGVVETIMSQFIERQFVVTDYYEHWKVHVTTGKEFKTEWQQFVQDVRKVSSVLLTTLQTTSNSR
jgi:hypothetical protein